jgi:uncharacterized repeat protein (TIGR03803 family)
MSATFNSSGKLLVGCGVALVISMAFASEPAISAEKALYSFQGGNDGKQPEAGVIEDSAGNLYGTTEAGGGGTGCGGPEGDGCGTIFALAPDGTETVPHAFAGGCDGAGPAAGLVADKAGNFYGTTAGGGVCGGEAGYGTVFKLAPDGTETVLYAFKGGKDGIVPVSTLIMDKKGNLYGTTATGGNPPPCNGNGDGCGTVFQVTPEGKKKSLYSFQGGSDGSDPAAGVIMDKAGNLYGTTVEGGNSNNGTVYKISADGTETTLYAFGVAPDGQAPLGGLVSDSSGNLYGTTFAGGSNDRGTVFKVTPDGTESVLHSFSGGTDGYLPEAGLIMDKAGNLYGTTYNGGGARACPNSGCGTVFKLAPDGTETVLYGFKTRSSGRHPAAPLFMGKHNVLYGTTPVDGNDNDGAVFSVTTK